MKILNTISLILVHSLAFAYNPEQLASWLQTHTCEACDLTLLNANVNTLGQLDLPDSNLTGSYFYGSSLQHMNLQRLSARKINAVGLMLHDNDLTEADFSYSDISRLKVTHWNRGDHIRFTGAFLSGSDFSYTEFFAPDFREAYLKNTSLYRVKWPQADLSNAILQSADLTFANLKRANLEGADLTYATTSHVDFSDANLMNAKISADQLKRALSVCNAILPDGSVGVCKLD